MADRGLHVRPQLRRGVRIAVEREQAAGVESLPRQDVMHVLTMPVAVDFDGDAALRRFREHPRPIRHHAAPAVVHTPLRMSEYGDARLLRRGDHASRLIRIAAQQRMGRSDHEFKLETLVDLQVERTIGEDVRLNAFEDAKLPCEPRVDPVDLTMLTAHVLHRHPTCDRQPVRVIGNAHARMSEVHARARHGLDPFAAITP